MEEINHVQAGLTFLQGVFERLEIGVDVSAADDQDMYRYILKGDLGALSTNADLVSALTLLTSQTLSRAENRRVDCILDLGGSFDERKVLLDVAVEDLAHAVSTTGRTGVLQGLSSQERKVIHNALKDVESVQTRSEGDDRTRMLVVEPS